MILANLPLKLTATRYHSESCYRITVRCNSGGQRVGVRRLHGRGHVAPCWQLLAKESRPHKTPSRSARTSKSASMHSADGPPELYAIQWLCTSPNATKSASRVTPGLSQSQGWGLRHIPVRTIASDMSGDAPAEENAAVLQPPASNASALQCESVSVTKRGPRNP